MSSHQRESVRESALHAMKRRTRGLVSQGDQSENPDKNIASDSVITLNNATILPKRENLTTVTAGGLLRKTVYFDQSEREKIELFGHEKGMKLSEVIRRSVREFLGMDIKGAQKRPGKKSRS